MGRYTVGRWVGIQSVGRSVDTVGRWVGHYRLVDQSVKVQ